jgi:hydroxyquinol 1,2-dioxygenase
VVIKGTVEGTDSTTVDELWQTAISLCYFQDNEQGKFNQCRAMTIGHNGRYALTTVKPSLYKMPVDGPVVDLVRAMGPNAWLPSHLVFIVRANCFRPVVKEAFANNDTYLNTKAVFGLRFDLIMNYVEINDHGILSDDLGVARNVTIIYYKVDFVLIPETK